MAHRNKIIRNAKTGYEILFLHTAQTTNGRFLGLIVTFSPHSQPPPPYYHPRQVVEFDVLSGELHVLLDGQHHCLTVGDHLQVEAGQQYALWSESAQRTSINCRVRPALNTEYLLETITGLANDGKTDDQGRPSILQAALLGTAFQQVIRSARQPVLLQTIVHWILTPFAQLAGYKPIYQVHVD